jgi:hypothetical protein
VLAGFELIGLRHGERERIGTVVGWLGPDGTWREDASIVAERLDAAAAADRMASPSPAILREALDRLAAPLRARLAIAAGRRWTVAEPSPTARRLAQRLGELIRLAARRRDGEELARLERALAFAAGGHTAGEAVMVGRLAGADARTLAAAIPRIPAASTRCEAIDARLIGLVVFAD